MRGSDVLLVFASILGVTASIVHEKRGNDGLFHGSVPLEKQALIPVRIGLSQRNLDRGYEHLMGASDPHSPSYGKHWSIDEVYAEFGPSADAISAVREWLYDAGIKHIDQTTDGGWLAFEAPVSKLENLLAAEYRLYSCHDGAKRLGCEEYSLPEHIAQHVDYVVPGVKMSPPVNRSERVKRKNIRRTNIRDNGNITEPVWGPLHVDFAQDVPPPAHNNITLCGNYITPICWQTMYGLPKPSSTNISRGVLGIFENGDVYAQEDINDFFKAYADYIPVGTHPRVMAVNGAQAPGPVDGGENTGESDVDLSIVYSLLGKAPVNLYQVQNPGEALDSYATLMDPLLDALDGSFCTTREENAGFECGAISNLTSILSVSYGAPELFYSTAASEKRACNEFMKLSLQGHTILVSSGDYGVASNPAFGSYGAEPDYCANGCVPQNRQNTGENAFNGTIFSPQFPAVCPYSLAIGATMLSPGQTVHSLETSMNMPTELRGNCPREDTISFSSGGGFSNYFAQPDYQASAVQSYLVNHAPKLPTYKSNLVDVTSKETTIGSNNGVFNVAGRAFPDVAANGARMLAYNQGSLAEFSGTSIAAPIWASIFALINSKRAEAGKGPVGFVAPTLYQNPQVFHDIVSGSNKGCYSAGFSAVPGWDPVTGLGTPDYAKLEELFLSLA